MGRLTIGSVLLPFPYESTSLKVSDALVLNALLMGEATQRSIAGQIEFWARLGRSIETLLRGDQLLALCKAGKARPLSACLSSVGSPEGRRRLAEHLKSLPYPHFGPAPGSAGLLVRIEANGKRTTGRFVNRKFQPVRSSKA
jgi:ParD-like antitoxin of type II bacterial toxin-antitoxin system